MRLGKCVQVTARGGPRGGWGGGGAAASHDQSCSHIIAGVTGAGGKSELTSFQAYEGLGGIHSAYSRLVAVFSRPVEVFLQLRSENPRPSLPLSGGPHHVGAVQVRTPPARLSPHHAAVQRTPRAASRQGQQDASGKKAFCVPLDAENMQLLEHTRPRGPQRAFALSVSHSIRVVCGCVGRVMAQLLPRLSPDLCKCGHG